MDVASLLTLLLLAFALAAQPWSVLAGILLVTAERGVTKELFYVLGWVLALSAVFVLFVVGYAALGFVVLAVGAQAPIAFVIAFVPMLFIAVPDAGGRMAAGALEPAGHAAVVEDGEEQLHHASGRLGAHGCLPPGPARRGGALLYEQERRRLIRRD